MGDESNAQAGFYQAGDGHDFFAFKGDFRLNASLLQQAIR